MPILLAPICDHMDSRLDHEDNQSSLPLQFSPLLLCNLRDDEDCSVKTLSCPTCFLDVRIDNRIVKSDPSFQMVIITKWQYMEIDSTPVVFQDNEGESALEFGPGEVREAYEMVTNTPFDSILGLGEALRYLKGSDGLTPQ